MRERIRLPFYLGRRDSMVPSSDRRLCPSKPFLLTFFLYFCSPSPFVHGVVRDEKVGRTAIQGRCAKVNTKIIKRKKNFLRPRERKLKSQTNGSAVEIFLESSKFF